MIDDQLKDSKKKMNAAVEILKKELAAIRTGHATPSLLEHISVEYAGVPTPLIQIAGISAPGTRMLMIQPWDKSCLGAIEKAIQKSDLGLNPTSDGNVIRINIPPLSEERRLELIKVVRARVEKEKVVVRNLRRDAMDELKKLEKNKDISQDDLKRALDQLQKLTDVFILDCDKIGKEKEEKLQEV